jgi:hypothetical protein
MDTKIEVLADVILEYAKNKADLFDQGRNYADKYRAYRRIEWLSVEMLDVLEQYRQAHLEEYEPVKRTSRSEKP